jgi:hypothetical protein
MSVSVSYNRLTKRIKVQDFVSTEYYKVDDIAYHMLCGQVLNLDAINELLKLDDEWFNAALENALNVLDLNNEVD